MPPDRPRLTVAVPTMNGARFLARTLRSVLAQSGTSFDLIVSDDRSDDETRTIAVREAGDRLRLVVNAERLGLARNWNQCVALSRTPYVAVVHQDDVLLPGHLAAHIAAFDADPAVGLVASASTVVDENDADVPGSVVDRGGLGSADRTFPPGEAIPLMIAGNPLRCSAVTLRAAAHADAGGFDPGYRYVVDWDLWTRLARRWSLRWIPEPGVAVRWHLSSETHRFRHGTTDLEESGRLLAAIVDRFEGPPSSLARPLAEAKRRLAQAYLNRAYTASRGGQGVLARDCFWRGVRLSPRAAALAIADPRFALRMAAVTVAPRFSDGFFAQPD